MDRTYIDNHHVVERYIADKLSDEERRAFEEYFIANPEIVKDIEAAARIKVGLHTLSETNTLNDVLKPAVRNRSGLWAMAASIVAVAIVSAVWFGRGVDSPLVAALSELSDPQGKPLTLADSYAVMRLRSRSNDAEIELPASQQAVELRILPEIETQPPRYRVTISRINDAGAPTNVGHIDGLIPREDGFVSVFFDSSQLGAGRYQLTLSGDADTSAAAEVSVFRILLRATEAPAP